MREDATLLMLTPTEQHSFNIFEVEGRSGFIDDLDFVPSEYQATQKIILYPIEDYVADLMQMPERYKLKDNTLDYYRNDGVTHLALISLKYEGMPLRWNNDEFTLGFVVYFCAAHNKYKLLHCTSCAQTIAYWVSDMQPEWGLNVIGQAVQKAGPTYH